MYSFVPSVVSIFFCTDDLADAVRFVHGKIAHLGGGEHVVALAPDPLFRGRLGIHVARADDGEFALVQDQTSVQLFIEYGDPFEHGELRGAICKGDPLVGEHFAHLLRAGRVPAEQHDAVAVGSPAADVSREVQKAVQIPAHGRGMHVIDFERFEKECF